MAALVVTDLPDNPLDAAAAFHARFVSLVRAQVLAGEAVICLAFDPAGPDHAAWRLAAVQGLAREAAPMRVNAVIGMDHAAIERTVGWLAGNAAITGQCLTLGGAGEPIVT